VSRIDPRKLLLFGPHRLRLGSHFAMHHKRCNRMNGLRKASDCAELASYVSVGLPTFWFPIIGPNPVHLSTQFSNSNPPSGNSSDTVPHQKKECGPCY
jgi:hypothetical protein